MESPSSVSGKAGLPPGTLIHVGEVHHPDTRISIIDFNAGHYEQQIANSLEQVSKSRDCPDSVTWLNIEGLSDIALIEGLGKQFNIHPLILEDILNTHQRPKVDEYDDCLFLVAKVIQLNKDTNIVDYQQISILLFDRLIFTFKERQDQMLLPIQERLRSGKGIIRQHGADYLVYLVLDSVIDQYFSMQDSMDEIIDSLEEELLKNPTRESLIKIQRVKRELIYIRRIVSPQRDMLGVILHTDTPLIGEKTRVYFRDVYDHVLRVSEAIDSYREMMTGLLDIYVSSISNKMNEIMKVLTVFASIFIPLTFLTGIYGMNFENMPELKWKWAYPVVWGVFITLPVVLLIYFKKKKWL